jgi:hypothetical protein
MNIITPFLYCCLGRSPPFGDSPINPKPSFRFLALPLQIINQPSIFSGETP